MEVKRPALLGNYCRPTDRVKVHFNSSLNSKKGGKVRTGWKSILQMWPTDTSTKWGKRSIDEMLRIIKKRLFNNACLYIEVRRRAIHEIHIKPQLCIHYSGKPLANRGFIHLTMNKCVTLAFKFSPSGVVWLHSNQDTVFSVQCFSPLSVISIDLQSKTLFH